MFFFWSALRTLRIYRSLFSSSPFCAFNNSRATVVTAIASRPLLLLYLCVCVFWFSQDMAECGEFSFLLTLWGGGRSKRRKKWRRGASGRNLPVVCIFCSSSWAWCERHQRMWWVARVFRDRRRLLVFLYRKFILPEDVVATAWCALRAEEDVAVGRCLQVSDSFGCWALCERAGCMSKASRGRKGEQRRRGEGSTYRERRKVGHRER